MSQSNQVTVPAALLTHTLTYVGASSLFAKKALDELGVHRTMQKAAADQRPGLLQHMISNEIVAQGQSKEAEILLADQLGSYRLIKAAVDKIVELKKTNEQLQMKLAAAGIKMEPGSASLVGDPKTASADADGVPQHHSLTTPFVGQRTSDVKASDLALMKAAGMG